MPATSRSDRSRSQKNPPSEKTMWEALEALRSEIASLKSSKPLARGELFLEVPLGGIIMWSRPLAEIPVNYQLCDGTNGTPNLLQRFIRGVEDATTDPGNTGGAETHVHDAVEGTMAAVPETAGTPAGVVSAPIFTGDAVVSAAGNGTPNLFMEDFTPAGIAAITTATGTNSEPTFIGTEMSEHFHLLEGLTEEVDHRPPYYDVAFIMRVA
jgi:hypothetical protein